MVLNIIAMTLMLCKFQGKTKVKTLSICGGRCEAELTQTLKMKTTVETTWKKVHHRFIWKTVPANTGRS